LIHRASTLTAKRGKKKFAHARNACKSCTTRVKAPNYVVRSAKGENEGNKLKKRKKSEKSRKKSFESV
jgi:hypothetical protein